MNKHGSGGKHKVTIQMIRNAGPLYLSTLHKFIQALWKSETLPEQFLEELLIPLYKKLAAIDPVNYRPISLMLTIAKIFQKLVNKRIKRWNSTQLEGGLASHSAYGGIKGRCRLMLVWTLNAQSLALSTNHTHYVASGDFDSAFPFTDHEVTDYNIHCAGLTGKLWRLSRKLESNLTAQLSINGKTSQKRNQERGLGQGAINSCDRFAWTTAPFYRNLEK